jgi:hypothetical protein
MLGCTRVTKVALATEDQAHTRSCAADLRARHPFRSQPKPWLGGEHAP